MSDDTKATLIAFAIMIPALIAAAAIGVYMEQGLGYCVAEWLRAI